MASVEEQGFCIYCRKRVPFNPSFPTCSTCGGKCSMCMRSSSTEETAYYCHGCGESTYVSASNPLCEVCRKKAP